MDSVSLLYIGIAILFMILMAIVFKIGRTKQLEVYSADDTVLKVTRKWNDGWNDNKEFMAFHDEDGELFWVAKHWIVRMREIKS